MWGGGTGNIPTGYQLCDGSAPSTSELQAIVGSIVPDLRDRFIVGATNSIGDTTYPGLSPGAEGGSANAVLISHNHRITANSSGSTQQNDYFGGSTNTYGINAGGSGDVNYDSTIKTKGITTSGADSTSQTGTNANLPPYYALVFMIKT